MHGGGGFSGIPRFGPGLRLDSSCGARAAFDGRDLADLANSKLDSIQYIPGIRLAVDTLTPQDTLTPDANTQRAARRRRVAQASSRGASFGFRSRRHPIARDATERRSAVPRSYLTLFFERRIRPAMPFTYYDGPSPPHSARGVRCPSAALSFLLCSLSLPRRSLSARVRPDATRAPQGCKPRRLLALYPANCTFLPDAELAGRLANIVSERFGFSGISAFFVP